MPKIHGIKKIMMAGRIVIIPTINGKFAPVTEWEKACVEAYERKKELDKQIEALTNDIKAQWSKEGLINDIKSQREEN